MAEDSYACYTETNNTSANVDINNDNKTWFYCAPERPLKRYVPTDDLLSSLPLSSSYVQINILGSFLYREQLSAKYQLWCVDECKRNDTAGAWTCNTLYGPDLCSPDNDKTVSRKTCTSPCELNEEEEEYYCETTDGDENCGFYGVPEEKKDILEFTIDDVVCADYCGTEKRGGDKDTCTVVEWEVVRKKVSNTA